MPGWIRTTDPQLLWSIAIEHRFSKTYVQINDKKPDTCYVSGYNAACPGGFEPPTHSFYGRLR